VEFQLSRCTKLGDLENKDRFVALSWETFVVQILLSVCICLARGFVDSSGHGRGPNSRSGGSLSG
jgi:hypothetical protein